MPKRNYFTDTEEEKAPGTANIQLTFKRAREDEELHYEKIGVSDLDSASKAAHVGIKKGNKDVFLETLTLTSAGYYYSPTRPIIVTSNNQLVVELVSPTANDRLRVNVNGYRVYEDARLQLHADASGKH